VFTSIKLQSTVHCNLIQMDYITPRKLTYSRGWENRKREEEKGNSVACEMERGGAFFHHCHCF